MFWRIYVIMDSLRATGTRGNLPAIILTNDHDMYKESVGANRAPEDPGQGHIPEELRADWDARRVFLERAFTEAGFRKSDKVTVRGKRGEIAVITDLDGEPAAKIFYEHEDDGQAQTTLMDTIGLKELMKSNPDRS